MITIQRKLPSFTVVEMLVVLVLSGLLVAIAYSVLTLTGKTIHSQKLKYDSHIMKTQVYDVFANDVENGREIIVSGYGFLIQNEEASLEYEIKEDYILRKASATDTFKLGNLETMFFFRQEAVHDQGKLTDHIRLSWSKGSEHGELNVYKLYDATTLMNYENTGYGN